MELECKCDPKSLWKELTKLTRCRTKSNVGDQLSSDAFNMHLSSIGHETTTHLPESNHIMCRGQESIYRFAFIII